MESEKVWRALEYGQLVERSSGAFYKDRFEKRNIA